MANPIERVIDDLLANTIDSRKLHEKISQAVQQGEAEKTPQWFRPWSRNLTDTTKIYQIASPSTQRKKIRITNKGPDEALILATSGDKNATDLAAEYATMPDAIVNFYPLDKAESFDFETRAAIYAVTVGTSLLTLVEYVFDTYLGEQKQ